MISSIISYLISCCEQDCVMVLASCPNNLNPVTVPVELFNVKTDFDLQGDSLVWFACTQLFFNCTLCPTGADSEGGRRTHKVSLV